MNDYLNTFEQYKDIKEIADLIDEQITETLFFRFTFLSVFRNAVFFAQM